MPGAYFVSDLHITAPETERARLFVSFLDRLHRDDDVSRLYLLGDIFDLWVGDHDYFVERYAPIVQRISRLVEAGVEVHYFEGNHDLHLQAYWAGKLGVAVYAGPAYMEFGARRLRLEHGDQMDPDDKGYRFLRWFLRTPPLRFLSYHLPGSFVAWLGDRASASSRAYTSGTKVISASDAVAKIRAHAARAYAVRPFDLLVSGHLHVRDDYQASPTEGGFRSINLGSWLDKPCYLRIDEQSVELCELGAGQAPHPDTAPGMMAAP